MSDDVHGKGDDAGTTLTPQERIGLIPTWIVTRADLNRAERANLTAGLLWVRRRRGFDVLDPTSLLALHARLFGDVWRWAGAPRESEKNIGPTDRWTIPQRLHQLLADIKAQVDIGAGDPDEVAVDFHHRLVALHVFPNGNGRHARIAADLLIGRLGQPPFTWGRRDLVDPGATRAAYVTALRAADAHDLKPLITFARS